MVNEEVQLLNSQLDTAYEGKKTQKTQKEKTGYMDTVFRGKKKPGKVKIKRACYPANFRVSYTIYIKIPNPYHFAFSLE